MAANTYDPHEHAHRLGIPVIRHPLTTCNGMWLPEQGVILMRMRIRKALDRSVLAHAIAHAVLGHSGQECSSREGKQERQANRLAASWLVDRVAFDDVRRAYNDPGRVCAELDITPPILTAWLESSQAA